MARTLSKSRSPIHCGNWQADTANIVNRGQRVLAFAKDVGSGLDLVGLVVIILFLNDFLTMAISTDRMEYSPRPNQWKTRGIIVAAAVLAGIKLIYSLGVFLVGHYAFHLDMPHLQTLTFATLILSSQAGVYLLRERGHFWQSKPSLFLMASSAFGLSVAGIFSLFGILMPAISPPLLLGVAGAGLA